jgi:hypothetical protein
LNPFFFLFGSLLPERCCVRKLFYQKKKENSLPLHLNIVMASSPPPPPHPELPQQQAPRIIDIDWRKRIELDVARNQVAAERREAALREGCPVIQLAFPIRELKKHLSIAQRKEIDMINHHPRVRKLLEELHNAYCKTM